MAIYYIVSNNGILKQYYSNLSTYSNTNEEGTVIFTPSPRNAKIFSILEDAKLIITANNLLDCNIIDQNGIIQKN